MAQKKLQRTIMCQDTILKTHSSCKDLSWKQILKRYLLPEKGIEVDVTPWMERLSNGVAAIVRVTLHSDEKIRGTFDFLRSDAPILLTMQTGQDTLLQLSKGQLVAERAHFCYYPKDAIMLTEYNNNGPRNFGHFGDYIMRQYQGQVEFARLEPIPNQGALSRAFSQKGRIKRVSMRMKPMAADHVESAFGGSLLGFGALASKAPTLSMSVTLSNGKERLPEEYQKSIATLLGIIAQDAYKLDQFTAFELAGETMVDLIKEHVCTKKKLLPLKDNSRVVDSDSAYAAMDEYYYGEARRYVRSLRGQEDE